MEDLLFVQHLQRAQQRIDDAAQPGFARRAVHAQRALAERAAPVVRHHHVRGAVRLPELMNLDERRMIEAGEQPRFVDE